MLERIMDGRTDLVFDLVRAGHSARSKDPNGIPIIRWCAYFGDVSAVRFLLENGEELAALGTNLDLNGAAFHAHWQLCEFLVEQGADVNIPLEITGETPLHSALCKANRPVYDFVVKILIAHGADPNAKTIPDVETGSFMRDCRTKGESALHRAAAFGTLASIDMLLGAGANKELKDANGDSPLSWASVHLRPAAILKKLCYGDFTINPENNSTYDHGSGWSSIDQPLGKPHVKKT